MLNLYKNKGETPLERITRFRFEEPAYAEAVLSYAGRLDPLAEGVLPIMVGEENKKREKFLNLTKEYIFDVLFGFSTDTYDVLGKVTGFQDAFGGLDKKVASFVKKLEKKFMQDYPAYSSKTVKGKPMFEWAKENKLSEIDIPQKQVEIYSLEIVDSQTITLNELKEDVLESIEEVKGDFRQQNVIEIWKAFFEEIPQETKFPVYQFKISCSSGTYVRSLANELGKSTGTGALALRIVRTKVGDLDIEDSLL